MNAAYGSRTAALAALIVATGYLVALGRSGYSFFYYDAQSYWLAAQAFGPEGDFSLLRYKDAVRGYALPLGLRPVAGLSASTGLNDIEAVRLVNVAAATGFGVVLVPGLVARLAPKLPVSLPRVLAFNALLFLFWRDHLNFPLSDFPALILGAIALALVLAARDRPWLLLVSGVAAGLALNVRPAYLTFAGALLVLVATRVPLTTRRSGWIGRGGALGLVVAGLSVALAPQIAMNLRTFDRPTPFPVRNAELASFQLTAGLELQKYETLITDGIDPRLFFVDRGTRELLPRDGRPVDGLVDYLGLVAGQPVRFLGGSLRRTFNGLDVQYSTPYVRDAERDRSGLRSGFLYVVLIAGLFAGGAILLGPGRSRARWLTAAVLLSPCLGALTSAMEPRFLLPAHATLYALVAFFPASAVGRLRRAGAFACGLGVVAVVTLVVGAFSLADGTYADRVDATAVDLPYELLRTPDAERQP